MLLRLLPWCFPTNGCRSPGQSSVAKGKRGRVGGQGREREEAASQELLGDADSYAEAGSKQSRGRHAPCPCRSPTTRLDERKSATQPGSHQHTTTQWSGPRPPLFPLTQLPGLRTYEPRTRRGTSTYCLHYHYPYCLPVEQCQSSQGLCSSSVQVDNAYWTADEHED